MLRLMLAVVCTAAFVAAAHASGYVGDTLNIQYRSTGHLQIELTGPKALIDRAQGLPAMPAGGCGYSFTWGDGTVVTPSQTAPYCKIDLKHTYAKPGRYELEAWVVAPEDQNAVEGKLHGKNAVILN